MAWWALLASLASLVLTVTAQLEECAPLQLPPAHGERSAIRFSTQYGMNAAVVRNACLLGDGVVALFGDRQSDPALDEQLTDFEGRLAALGQFGFRFGWRFVLHPPADAAAVRQWEPEDRAAAVLRPAFGHNIAHFAEAVLFLWHAALHPAVYPWFSDLATILLPTVHRTRELNWNLEFLDLVLRATAAHGARLPTTVTFAEDTKPRQCFRRLGLVGMATSEFGLFASADEAQRFRAFAFHHWGLPAAPATLDLSPNAKVRTLVLHREQTRRMSNLPAVLDALARTGLIRTDHVLAQVNSSTLAAPTTAAGALSFEGRPLREQAALMRASDLLIATHGSGIINAIFMERGSVVVDLLCPHFPELTFTTAVLSAGSYYLFLPNTNRSSATRYPDPVPLECFQGSGFEAARMACLAIRNCDLEVDVAALELLVHQAAVLVRLHKRQVHRGTDPTGWWARGRPGEPLLD